MKICGRTINAVISNIKLITIKIVPGENFMYMLSITDIPLVPPKNKECGNIKNTVEKAYNILPKIINI